MNARKAKALRKEVYGDLSQRARKYSHMNHGQQINHPDSLRAKYLKLKREAK